MVTVAEINDNASYVYETQFAPPNKGIYFGIEVEEETTYSFHIDLHDRNHLNCSWTTLELRKIDSSI